MTPDTFHDETDAALAEAALRWRRERFDFASRQRLDAATRRFDAGTWAEMAEMGWLAVATGEDDGGLGRRIGSIALLASAAGASGICEPLLSTGFVAAEILRVHASAQQRARWLPPLLAGQLRVACAFAGPIAPHVQGAALEGRCEVVPDADIADLLLVQAQTPAGLRWHAVPASNTGLRRTPYPLLDGRGAATLQFDRCEAEPLNEGEGSETPALVAAFAASADALGAMETAFALTLDYIKTRKQFGVAIGSNQAVVHRTVDMYLRLEESRAVLAQAAEALAEGSVARQADVHAAKAFIPVQGQLLAQEAVQLHGGIGMTEEYQVSHCLRRILVDEQLFGGAREHLRRFAQQPLAR